MKHKVFVLTNSMQPKSKHTKNVDIVIPSWNQADLTKKCLKTIREYSTNYRVIFVDNGSTQYAFDQVYEVLKTMPHLLVRNHVNLGFIKAVNIGLSIANAPYIILMNNDTEAVESWIEKLQAPLRRNIAASGPLTTTQNSWQGVWRPKNKDVFIIPKTAMLAFFCVMFTKEAIDNIGLLNEEYGVGLGDDDDYCNRLHQAGYDLALIQDLVIPHHHRSTFKELYTEEEIANMQNKAMEKLKKEWHVGKRGG